MRRPIFLPPPLRAAVVLLVAALGSPAPPAPAKETSPPPWEPVPEADRALKEWAGDPEAVAAILHDERAHELEIVEGAELKAWSDTRRRRRIKVLRPGALEQDDLLNVSVPHGTDSKLLWVRARTVQADGTVREVRPEDMRDTVLYRAKDKSYEVLAKTFAFADVRPGSIIEYEWLRRDESFAWNPWYFRNDLPTRLSRMSLTLSPTLFVYRARRNQITLALEPREEKAGTRKRIVYEARDVPALPREPFMPRDPNVRDSVEFLLTGFQVLTPMGLQGTSIARDWTEAMSRRWEIWLDAATEPGKFTRAALREAAPAGAGGAGAEARARALADWVRRNVARISYPLDEIIYADAETVLEDREAIPSGHATALLALLRAAQIEAYPAFLLPYGDPPFRDDWPAMASFRELAVALPLPGANPPWRFLFPSQPRVRFGALPWEYVGGTAVVYRPKNKKVEVVALPESEEFAAAEEAWTAKTRIEGEDLAGDLVVLFTGQEALFERESNTDATELLKGVRAEVLARRAETELGEGKVDGFEDSDRDLTVTLPFRIPGAVRASEGTIEVDADLFPDPDAAPVRAPRRYQIVFRTTRTESFRHELTLPAGAEAKRLPRAGSHGSGDLTARIESEAGNGTYRYARIVRWNRGMYAPEGAEAIQAFYAGLAPRSRETAVFSTGAAAGAPAPAAR